MYEFENVLDITHPSYTCDKVYEGFNNSDGSSTKAPIYIQDEAIIRELLTGDIAVIEQGVNDANNAVSTIQILTDAIETITEKLIRMFEMTPKTLFPDDSEGQIEDWQSYLHKLAKEINQITHTAEDNFNQLLTESGNIFSVLISNCSKVDILA